MADNRGEMKNLNVKCPYCDGKLSVIMERNPNPLEREYYPDGFECETYSCGATWDLSGVATNPPSHFKD